MKISFKSILTSVLAFLMLGFPLFAQKVTNDSQTPLHLLQPAYPIPYGELSASSIKASTDLILKYLMVSTPMEVENNQSHVKITDFNAIDENSQLVRGGFRLASYEWGVTYAAMMRAFQTTGDSAYLRYASDRMKFLATVAPSFKKVLASGKQLDPQMRQILAPHALDDAGAVCAAMIKVAVSTGDRKTCDALILNYMNFVLNKEKKLADGTYARNRPFPNTVWLDDMYMSLPAIAQYGVYTGMKEYNHQAAQLVLNFASRMFVPEKNLFRHGWVESMNPHPSFYWGRANGWAILSMCEVLDVLPVTDPLYPLVLSLYQRHAAGLSALQSGTGFWHQLLDRNDSYLETSATAHLHLLPGTWCQVRVGWMQKRMVLWLN